MTYKIGNGTETPVDLGNPENDVSFTLTELPAGDTRITVTAVDNAGNRIISYKDVHVDIVSVEITWADMEFTYSDGTWNTATHTSEGVGWSTDTVDGNKVTVHNAGEVDVSVSYGYTQDNIMVSGGFITDGEVPVTTPVDLPAGEDKSAWLVLDGKPNETMYKEVLGSVTVTIGGD